jgi:hypothetical protein
VHLSECATIPSDLFLPQLSVGANLRRGAPSREGDAEIYDGAETPGMVSV